MKPLSYRKPSTSFLSLGALLPFLVACGGTPHLYYTNEFEPYDPNNYSYVGPEDSRPRALDGRTVEFSCTSDSCSPGQSFVLTQAENKQISVCSATLIAPDLLLTNEHCLPERTALGCSTMQFFFPRLLEDRSGTTHVSVEAESRTCAEIVKVSDRNSKVSDDEDFAVLRLSAPVSGARPLARISTEGVKDKTPLVFRASVASYTSSHYWVRPVLNKCESITHGFFVPSYTQALSMIVGIKGCNPLPGNSGSGLFDLQGQLVAVVQSGKANSEPFEFLNKKYPNPPLPSSNLACIDPFNETSDVLRASCKDQSVAHAKSGHYVVRIQENIEARIGQLNTSFDANNSFKWDYEIVSKRGETHAYLVPHPVCLKARSLKGEEIKLRNFPVYRFWIDDDMKIQVEKHMSSTSLKLTFSDLAFIGESPSRMLREYGGTAPGKPEFRIRAGGHFARCE